MAQGPNREDKEGLGGTWERRKPRSLPGEDRVVQSILSAQWPSEAESSPKSPHPPVAVPVSTGLQRGEKELKSPSVEDTPRLHVTSREVGLTSPFKVEGRSFPNLLQRLETVRQCCFVKAG